MLWNILLAAVCFVAGAALGATLIGGTFRRYVEMTRPVGPILTASHDVRALRALRAGNTDSLCTYLEVHLDRSLIDLVDVVQTTRGAVQDPSVRQTLARICEYREEHPSPHPMPAFDAHQLSLDQALKIARSVADTATV